MRIIAVGDLHASISNPVNRIDSYLDAVIRKLIWIFNTAKGYVLEGDSVAVIFPGDIFELFDSSNYLVQILIKIFRTYSDFMGIYCVAGNHDLKHRSQDLERTSLGVLLASESLIMLGSTPEIPESNLIDKIAFYGVNFGIDDIPGPSSRKDINVLVVHHMISDKDYWYDKVKYNDAESFLRKHKGYRLIVSGHNHKFFKISSDGRHLINCGSVVRSTIAQIDHVPVIGVYNTQTRRLITLKIPADPPHMVLDMETYEKNKNTNEKMSIFVTSLKDEMGMISDRVNFKERLFIYMKENKLTKRLMSIAKEVLDA